LKRGYYVVLAGAVLFVIGIVLTAVWTLPIAQQVQKDTTLVQQISLKAGKSISAEFNVTDSERALSVVISAKSFKPMTATLIGHGGEKVVSKEFNETLADSVTVSKVGTYRLMLTNDGQTDTTADIVFGHIPGLSTGKNVNLDAFKGIIAGAGTIIAGIMVMIGGAILMVIDRRKK
jgi:uncharacterized membrane protein